MEQLTKLLDGFTEVAKIEGEQHLFVRDMDDHRQVVHCMVNDQGQITRIEAFVGALAEGANRAELNEQLWVKLAELEYKQNDTEELIAKLTGPQPNYAVSAFHKVGYATFCLPDSAGGKRNQLVVWARDPVNNP